MFYNFEFSMAIAFSKSKSSWYVSANPVFQDKLVNTRTKTQFDLTSSRVGVYQQSFFQPLTRLSQIFSHVTDMATVMTTCLPNVSPPTIIILDALSAVSSVSPVPATTYNNLYVSLIPLLLPARQPR